MPLLDKEGLTPNRLKKCGKYIFLTDNLNYSKNSNVTNSI